MAHIVLLPGAWLEGAVFGAVVAGLRDREHQATAVTFPGLADNLTDGPDLESWIATVVQRVNEGAAGEIVLVGHSFSGLIAGAVADRVPARIGHLVYLDANLPVDGESFTESWSESGQQWLADQIELSADGCWPPDLDQSETRLNDVDQQVLLGHAFPMPAAVPFQRSVLSSDADLRVPTTYVLCTQSRTDLPPAVADRLERSNWDLRHLDTGHWPMVSNPDQLAALLDDIATGAGSERSTR